jgi:hypothetical protein
VNTHPTEDVSPPALHGGHTKSHHGCRSPCKPGVITRLSDLCR